MPEAPVMTPPAAPAGGAAPPSAPASAPASPRVTFGDPGSSAPPKETPAVTTPPSDAEPKFDFGFGDDAIADAPAEPGEETNYAEPFDPEFEKLLAADPERLKKAKAAWYDNRNWKKSGFKNAQELQNHVNEVNTLASSLNRQDGTKGLDAIKAEAAEWAATTQGIRSGDPATLAKVLDQIQEPASLDKLIGAALKYHQEKNPAGWARSAAQNFMGELRAQNARGESVLTGLNRLVELTKESPEAQAVLRSIAEQINQLDDISRNAPAATNAPANDPERQKLESEKRGIFVQKLSMRVMPQINSAAQKAASTILAGRKLGDEAMKSFVQEIQGEYNRITKGNADFQSNAKKLLDAGDIEGFEKLTRAQIVRAMPTAAKNINRKYQGFAGDTAQRKAEGEAKVEGAAGGSQSGAKLKYNGKMSPNGGPDPSVIDWQAMRAKFGGRKQAEDALFDHTFMVKGDPKNVYFW